ncbi:MAG: c-type cytochrome domain-containing protein [Isosphaeraceae bacterium]
MLLLALLSVPAWSLPSVRGDEASTPTYERDIKPILAKRCTVCHSSSKKDDLDLSGGLALDTIEGALAGTKRHKVVVPRRADESELLRRLTDPDVDRRMPLEDKPLSVAQQELFRRWIDAGAPRGSAPVVAAGNSAIEPATKARPRRTAWLEVVIPTEVKLAPRTWNATKGGALTVSAPIGPLPAVTALVFRGDSRLLAVGTYGQVVLWDLGEGRPAASLGGIPGPVHALAFSRDGRRLAVGAGLPARSGLVRVYSVPDGTKIHEFIGHGDVVFALAFRPDGGQLASASFDQTVRFWDLGQCRPAGIFRGHSDFVYALAYTPDGKALYSAGKDRTIKRINSHTQKEERTYSSHDDDVLAVAIRPDGKRFVSAGNEPQLRWWAFDGDRPIARRGGHSGPVQQLAFSGDGRRLLSVAGDGSVRLWNGQTGEPLRPLPGARDWQYAAAISDDGRLAAAGGWDGLVRLWDADSGRLRGTLVQPPDRTASQNVDASPARCEWLAVSSGGYLAGSTGLIGQVSWRSGGVTLPAEAARRVCVSGESLARALRGDPLPSISFPPIQPRN